MWYHYADQYRGLVLEFECVDELDSASLRAKPVEYPLVKPAIYTAEGWAKLLMMQNRPATEMLLELATFTKSPDWSYEREWRVTSWKRPADTDLYTDYSFDQRELGAIYLGPMISPSDRETVTALAKGYVNCVVWNVTIGMDREFHFTKSNVLTRGFNTDVENARLSGFAFSPRLSRIIIGFFYSRRSTPNLTLQPIGQNAG